MIIRQGYDTGKTIYVIFRNDAGEAWDTTGTPAAYETYATASLANYDVAAVEQGTASQIYECAVPAGVAADNFMADWRVRIGATPAETDPCIAMQAYYVLADIIDSMWDETLETGVTVRQAMQRMAAVLGGKVTGAGTGVETFVALDGTTKRVKVVVDALGNRSLVEYDPA